MTKEAQERAATLLDNLRASYEANRDLLCKTLNCKPEDFKVTRFCYTYSMEHIESGIKMFFALKESHKTGDPVTINSYCCQFEDTKLECWEQPKNPRKYARLTTSNIKKYIK